MGVKKAVVKGPDNCTIDFNTVPSIGDKPKFVYDEGTEPPERREKVLTNCLGGELMPVPGPPDEKELADCCQCKVHRKKVLVMKASGTRYYITYHDAGSQDLEGARVRILNDYSQPEPKGNLSQRSV